MDTQNLDLIKKLFPSINEDVVYNDGTKFGMDLSGRKYRDRLPKHWFDHFYHSHSYRINIDWDYDEVRNYQCY